MTGTPEETPAITFDVQYGSRLSNEERDRQWLARVLRDEQKTVSRIAFVFVSDEILYDLNLRHLRHDTYTDILTFPYSNDPIEAEIYISVDRVQDNARNHNATPDNELHRVMVHGVLHMCGYGDATADEKAQMREKENHYLGLWEGMASG